MAGLQVSNSDFSDDYPLVGKNNNGEIKNNKLSISAFLVLNKDGSNHGEDNDTVSADDFKNSCVSSIIEKAGYFGMKWCEVRNNIMELLNRSNSIDYQAEINKLEQEYDNIFKQIEYLRTKGHEQYEVFYDLKNKKQNTKMKKIEKIENYNAQLNDVAQKIANIDCAMYRLVGKALDIRYELSSLSEVYPNGEFKEYGIINGSSCRIGVPKQYYFVTVSELEIESFIKESEEFIVK